MIPSAMAPSATVLVVEDEALLARNIKTYLQRLGYEVHVTRKGEDALERVETFRPSVVLVDFMLPDINGLEVLRRVRRQYGATRVIVMTGQGSEKVAVDAMKAGAYDYLAKPVALENLRVVVEKAAHEARLSGAIGERNEGLARLIGDSPAMAKLKNVIRQVIESDSKLADATLPAVLISGPTGSGKELIARAIHFEGPRAAAQFVRLDCTASPAHLVEAGQQGTLFLDQVGELDAAMQVRLLRLLEEHAAGPRIVAATSCDLAELVREGKFRSDLYFRLCIVKLEAPGLAACREDVPLLAQHFLAWHGVRYGKPHLRLTYDALQLLAGHSWPGNVRELQNVLEQAVVLARDDQLDADAFAGLTQGPPQERETLIEALSQTGWNITRAAKLLGIARDALRYRMEKFRLRPPSS